ncbi:hypothetical protein GALMADRAFT_1341935 [Galerina marginata CBS 339.88]|uniref:Uncharacterized protein n=1 Tax=Galerina marginata (strain CBS 339.88) TaxID=685588 RepID=A0A067STH7_GALM3|nr:hypothetical protein GALMADRAFT_1341935 [Galerina marginata CBS 339.88]
MDAIYRAASTPPTPKILLFIVYSTVYPAIFAIAFLIRLLYPAISPLASARAHNSVNYSHSPLQGVVVFQYESSLVYIKPPASYQEAVETAQREFQELSEFPFDRIAFFTEVGKSNSRRIRISESAWVPCVRGPNMPPETIHISILPDAHPRHAPPRYLERISAKSSPSPWGTLSWT